MLEGAAVMVAVMAAHEDQCTVAVDMAEELMVIQDMDIGEIILEVMDEVIGGTITGMVTIIGIGMVPTIIMDLVGMDLGALS